jgi:hypothetical protein
MSNMARNRLTLEAEVVPTVDCDTTAAMIDDIIRLNERICRLWHDGGWAPVDAANLLRKSRLDRLVSLSRKLRLWLPGSTEEDEGGLILAWANLGALVEGTLKWFLCVFEGDYSSDRVVTEQGRELDPDELWFIRLCRFFRDHVWIADGPDGRYAWCDKIRRRRNGIHAFDDRDIGTWEEFYQDIERYRELIKELEGAVPEPPVYPY